MIFSPSTFHIYPCFAIYISVFTVIISCDSFSFNREFCISEFFNILLFIKFAKSLHASLSFRTTLFLTIIKILSDIIHTNYHAISQIGKQCTGIYPAHFCLLWSSLRSTPVRAEQTSTGRLAPPIPLNCWQAAEPRCHFFIIFNFSSLNLHHKDV